MMSFYSSYKLKEKINELYLALYKHKDEITKLEKEMESDPAATARNDEIKREITDHKEHCKRLLDQITELEEKL